ncbi:hypothetical protein [Persephonella sp.]
MGFLKGLFKDDNGKWSFSRVSTAIILSFYLAISGYIAVTEKTIPDIPDNLYLLLLSLYGVNKLASAFKSFKSSE